MSSIVRKVTCFNKVVTSFKQKRNQSKKEIKAKKKSEQKRNQSKKKIKAKKKSKQNRNQSKKEASPDGKRARLAEAKMAAGL